MTERIYATDSYRRELASRVVDVDREDGRVLLDRTVFYPGGGGQPHDVGELHVGDDRLRVVRVTEDTRGVWHWLEDGLPGVGTRVCGVVDWERRYRLMRTLLPREEADLDPHLIRTKVSLLPPELGVVRVVDIVGLDRQADGGTHVASTREVGRVSIAKVESKGRGFRRFRIVLTGTGPDAAG